jgi:predicted transcriptional regulator
MKRWTLQEEQKLKEMRQKGKAYTEIAEVLGRTERSIKDRIREIAPELRQPIYRKKIGANTEQEKIPSNEEIHLKLVLAFLAEFDSLRSQLESMSPQFMKIRPRLYTSLFRCTETLLRILKSEPEETDIDKWAEIIAEKLPPDIVEPRKLLRQWISKRKKL